MFSRILSLCLSILSSAWIVGYYITFAFRDDVKLKVPRGNIVEVQDNPLSATKVCAIANSHLIHVQNIAKSIISTFLWKC